jgi:CHAD domain-containing protein
LRYAAEACAPIAGRRARRLAHAVDLMQTILGDQHDSVVACERLRELRDACDVAFVAGELAVLEAQGALEGRRIWRSAWRAAKRARRQFAKAL